MSRFTDVLIDLRNDAHGSATDRIIAALTPPATIQPAQQATYLTLLVERFVRNMVADGVLDPLAQRLTLASVLYDLLTLAEAPTPAAISELVGAHD
jgi:hypothetical protein